MATAVSAKRINRAMPITFIVWAVACLAGVGAIVSAVTFGSNGSERIVAHKVGESVPTTFGIVAVEHAELRGGLSAAELGGVTHGVRNLTTDAQAEVQASITLTNQTNDVVKYSPGQFRVLMGPSHVPVPLTGTSLLDGSLQPSANVNGTLSFIVARNDQQVLLEYRDLNGRRIFIDLGKVDQAPAGAGDPGHSH